MKKLLQLLILLPLFAFSQFTISDTSDNWTEVGKVFQAIKLEKKKDNTKAKIIYKDLTYINNLNFYEFEFSTYPDTLDKLYDICLDNLKNKNVGKTTLTFPEGNMIVSAFKEMGGFFINFEFEKVNDQLDKGEGEIRYTFGLNQSRLNKLFGKK